MAIMDETSCRWSSIPASKRASHVIIIGFLCLSLAVGLSNGGELRPNGEEYADTRQDQHYNQHLLHTLLSSSSQNRDAKNSANTFELKQYSQHKDSATMGDKTSSHRNYDNVIHQKVNALRAAASDNHKSSASSISLLTASILLRLNSSPHSSSTSSSLSSGTHRERARGQEAEDEGVKAGASGVTLPLSHHQRPAGGADANRTGSARDRVRRYTSTSRGNQFLYKPNKPKQLFCRTNYRLAVHEDGMVNGTKDINDIFSSLIIEAQRRSYVSIRGIRSKLYVCVNDSGEIYGSKHMSRHCYFQESIERNFFNTYAFTMPHNGNNSKRRSKRTQFLTINKYGALRLAKTRSQKKAQFITLVPPTKLL